jgi:hypothetical protein
MACKADKKFNYFLRKKKIIMNPFLRCKISPKPNNNSVLIMRQTSILPTSSLFQYYIRSNDISSTVYATTIIIFFATWIFKKETYVKKFLYFSSLFISNRINKLFLLKEKRMLIRIPFRLISSLFLFL